MHALVDRAFKTNRNGELKTAAILDLLTLEIDDDEWQRAMEALKDSIFVANTAVYVRVYFAVTMLDAGCTAPIAAKAFVATTGRRLLELLIFPDGAQNEELLRLLGNGLVLDSPLDSLSQIAPGRCYASLEEDFSKDVELGPAERISASPEEEEDHVGGLGPLLSIRWRQAPLILSKVAQRSETDDTRVAHALSPTQETIIPPDLISTTVSKGQTGGAQGGRQKGGCRAS